VLFLLSTAVVMRFVSPVVAEGTIYIRPDGSVDPSTAPIQRDGNVYTFTDNIYDEIVVERDNIVVDGAGSTLQGTGSGTGIDLSDRSNVAIQNMQIRYFDNGIYLEGSSGNNIYGNTITNNDRGIYLRDSSSNNIYGNTITNNDRGIHVYRSSENIFYHNNFIDNTEQVHVRSTRENVWDDGYPSGGNYWSDYTGVDQYRGPDQDEVGSDGIGDTEYLIDDINRDRYPLMSDLVPPTISIISPENKTYAVTTVTLTFTVSETTSWMGYSLDGQANATVSGNTTLDGLSEGIHTITVYAADTAGNTGHSDTVYFTIDTVGPNIEIVSPENKTYAVADVPWVFIVSEATSWMGYSLDGQVNVTVGGNTSVVDLSDGVHTITVYAADVAGNMGSSGTVYFTVDTTLPVITILSPENRTYAENDVPLSFTVDKAVSWMAYSLDGQANATITGNTTLASLVDGVHYVVVYANNTAGKMGTSNTVYFTVDNEAPIIIILSPKNETYASTSFSLNFTQSEPTSWMGYSLDGQMNVTVSDNITLVGLPDGVHTITVYAKDAAGNMGRSVTVYFTINALPPNIELFSPENKTYTTDSVSLNFSVNEPTLWKGYSLDGQANVTIFGDTTLAGLSEGSHSLVVYVRDVAGNAGTSEIVYFAVETRQTEPSQLWVVAVIAIVAGIGFTLSGYMAYDLLKRAQK